MSNSESPSSMGLSSKLSTIENIFLYDNLNPLWKGPYAEGPLGGITQSMIARFFSCRERFRLKYVCGLEPHDKWTHRLGYGNMWHVCEESLSKKGTNSWVSDLCKHTNDQIFTYPFQRDEITKWYNVCATQFPVYVDYWKDHPDVLNRTPLFQEEVFDVPYNLPSGRVVRLRGKYDSVDIITDEITGPKGGIYIQENKTKGDIDKLQVEKQLKFDLQTMMYIVALHKSQEISKFSDLPIFGVRYNVVRRPLSGGKGSISPHKAKYTKTKIVPAETSEQFYERLRRDYIAKEPEYWFFRVRVEISNRDIDVFCKTCLDPILEQICCWYDELIGEDLTYLPPFNYRTPFGMYSALDENGTTEYDTYIETGSDAGLRRVNNLFNELQ